MDTRKHDKAVIENGLRASDPNERNQAQKAMDRIKREDSWTREARERLVIATKNHQKDNATDIRDQMVKHEGRKGNHGSVSFAFHFPEGFWDK